MVRAVASFAMAAVVAACGGFLPAAGAGPIVDIGGVGSATLVVLQPPAADAERGTWTWRWTGARAVLAADDGQLLVAWTGGPPECWVAAQVHLDARGNSLAASVGERPAGPEGQACNGDRTLWAVLTPDSAVPRAGGVSDWPSVPEIPNNRPRP